MAKPAAPQEWTVLRMLEWATEYFEEKKVPSPRLSIEWLLADALGCKRLDLYLKFDRPLSRGELDVVKPGILRRSKQEPLQYITGSTDFYGLELFTDSSALIPRPETEQLVEHILSDHAATTELRVLDIGTGSGCIPIALKHERPAWSVYGCDISPQALALAHKNARKHDLTVEFVSHNLFNATWPFADPAFFDIIVSNPPYIPEQERAGVDEEVKNYEPSLALFHPNIFSVYESVGIFAQKNLRSGGMLYLEVHENYGPEILRQLTHSHMKGQLITDYSDKSRFIQARRTHSHE